MNNEMTQWFKPEDKPTRIGVYEKDYESDRVREYQYWDGDRWHYGTRTPIATVQMYAENKEGSTPNPRGWRGFTTEQKS